MRNYNKACWSGPVSLILCASNAIAQQPPDIVVSDRLGNTAAGTEALKSAQTTGSGPLAEENTAVGIFALDQNVSGSANTAIGARTMIYNTTGGGNTALGQNALSVNTTGNGNTGIGMGALSGNSSGEENTGVGSVAMGINSTGHHNTAVGSETMGSNSSGSWNSAFGWASLGGNSTGNYNTASGAQAMALGSGSSNTATGAAALYWNTGDDNTALGASALRFNKAGSSNTAVGHRALFNNRTGLNNIGVGTDAGTNIVDGSNNIEVGNPGTTADSAKIRIGTLGVQQAFYAAGIANAKVTGSAVYVTASGQLGVLASSQRYKTDIGPMGDKTERLRQLQPVTFRLTGDPDAGPQYGLVAEAVAKVYPELVTRDASGTVEGVRYEELAPMLLNEVQKQQRTIEAQGAALRRLQKQLRELRHRLPKSG